MVEIRKLATVFKLRQPGDTEPDVDDEGAEGGETE
jgi:hypothetical protein